MRTFGEKLKEIRKSRNMTQENFAELLGTSKQVISRYETNQRIPKISIAQKYADILGFSLSDLSNNEFNPFYKDTSETIDHLILQEKITEAIQFLDDKELEKILKLANNLYEEKMAKMMGKYSNKNEKEQK